MVGEHGEVPQGFATAMKHGPTGEEMARFGPDDRPTACADIEVAVFEGEAVLFDVQASMVHHLSAVPAATWLCCDGETTVADMVNELVGVFELVQLSEIAALSDAIHESLARFASEGLLLGHPRVTRSAMEPGAEVADHRTEILMIPDDP